MKTFKQFNESFMDNRFDIPTQQAIESKRMEVRDAYSKYGVGSEEYESLFNELHNMIVDYDQRKKDHYMGKLPKPKS